MSHQHAETNRRAISMCLLLVACLLVLLPIWKWTCCTKALVEKNIAHYNNPHLNKTFVMLYPLPLWFSRFLWRPLEQNASDVIVASSIRLFHNFLSDSHCEHNWKKGFLRRNLLPSKSRLSPQKPKHEVEHPWKGHLPLTTIGKFHQTPSNFGQDASDLPRGVLQQRQSFPRLVPRCHKRTRTKQLSFSFGCLFSTMAILPTLPIHVSLLFLSDAAKKRTSRAPPAAWPR